MITIIQNKDRATFRVINDVAFDEVTVMMQDAEAADEMIYHLLVKKKQSTIWLTIFLLLRISLVI